MKLLEELCEVSAIPGREQALIDIMKRELKKTTDEVTVDDLGNVVGIKYCRKKNAKKVMIAGHMDEIGFIVSHIDKNGFIRFSPRGGHIPRVLISQRVRICGKKEIVGIVEGSSVFLKKEDKDKTPELKDLFIDTGFKADALRKIVDVGDMIVLDRGFQKQGEVFISKAFDDRVGCFIVLETMKRLKTLDVDVYAVGTAQEEVGIRGAMGAARGIEPDIGVAVDITAALDTPGAKEHEWVTQLGEGVAIKINDTASISNHGIVEFLKNLAQKHKIKTQLEVLPFGGTDARAMQMFGRGGVCTLSIPTRYAHTPNEMVSERDVRGAVDLLVHFLESSHQCRLQF